MEFFAKKEGKPVVIVIRGICQESSKRRAALVSSVRFGFIRFCYEPKRGSKEGGGMNGWIERRRGV